MRGLVQSLGPDCELALHHFRDVSSSLVNIEGPVTGRSQGAPLADLVPRILHQGDDPPDLVNYQPQTSEGRLLLFSPLFIRDDYGSVPGCLCLDRDVTRRIVACNLLKDFCRTYPLDNSESGSQETFIRDMEDILHGTINEILTQERKPVKLMDKADNVRMVRALDARGIFVMKGAVEGVACALNVSRYTATTSTKGVGSESSLSTKVDSG